LHSRLLLKNLPEKINDMNEKEGGQPLVTYPLQSLDQKVKFLSIFRVFDTNYLLITNLIFFPTTNNK